MRGGFCIALNAPNATAARGRSQEAALAPALAQLRRSPAMRGKTPQLTLTVSVARVPCTPSFCDDFYTRLCHVMLTWRWDNLSFQGERRVTQQCCGGEERTAPGQRSAMKRGFLTSSSSTSSKSGLGARTCASASCFRASLHPLAFRLARPRCHADFPPALSC
jgi:hypothetical protein